MSAALHMATPEDLDRVLTLVTAFHAEEGLSLSDDQRRGGVLPLLDGSPYGTVYLIGPRRAPIGYVAITFTWSIEFGGLNAILDEIYLKPAVRGRGIASEVLIALTARLFEAGVCAIELDVDNDNAAARKLYTRTGFKPRARYLTMTRQP